MKYACVVCGRISDEGRCAEHRRRDPARRGTWGGSTWKWRKLREQVLERDGYRCYKTGCTTRATTVDHIRPRSKGGGEELSNLRAACEYHNYSRGNRSDSAKPDTSEHAEPPEPQHLPRLA